MFFSFFYTVTNAASSAAPDQVEFPPFPPDQELQGEGFPEKLPPKDAEHIYYYRGNRTYQENLPLEVNYLNCNRIDEDTVILEIVFNQSINPRSVNRDSFLIDNNTLPDGIRFSFNRKGDRIKIEVSMTDDSFEIKVQNVRAFDGTMIEPVEIVAQIESDETQDSAADEGE